MMFNLKLFIWILAMSLTSQVNGAKVANEQTSNERRVVSIALPSSPTSLDPHYKTSLAANYHIINHVMEPLFRHASDGTVEAILINNYDVLDPLNWEFTLKQSVPFHDGKTLTTDDVIASFNRVMRMEDNNSFKKFLGSGLSLKKLDENRFRITTDQPDPDLLRRLVNIMIIPQQYEAYSEADFNQTRGLIGTGPFVLEQHDGFESFSFNRFEEYHGQPAKIKRSTLRVIKNKTQRIQLFKEKQIDFISGLSPSDMTQLSKALGDRVNFNKSRGTKLYHIRLDQYRDLTPFVKSNNGQPLESNPLKDVRVRKALSLAIDRDFLVSKYFNETGATPTGQLINKGFRGYMPRLSADSQNTRMARQLLTEAGYANGFTMTLHDKEARHSILTDIAQMLGEVGIRTSVDTPPSSIYFPNNSDHAYSASLLWSNSNGSIRGALQDLVRTGGSVNSGRYSNQAVDQAILKADNEFDRDERYRFYSRAMELAVKDYAIVPLYFINDIWATQPDLLFRSTMKPYPITRHLQWQ